MEQQILFRQDLKYPRLKLLCKKCGLEIFPVPRAVAISYGYIAKTGRFICREGSDFFHVGCDKSFRM